LDDKQPLKGRGQGHVTHFQFRRPQSGTAEARIAKFCMQVEYIKC